MLKSAEIRQKFLDFFQDKGHKVVPSAPIVIKNDPTLMFTNAGMNQFKDLFLGNAEAQNKRIADSQKCLRVSGKHNDLEEVGHDTYHHTMFEMLGNWSFGDYFKKEAIEWAWELLTKVYRLPKDRLYVTVFEGAADDGLGKDEEAFKEWKKWIAEERILNGSKKDNFWEMGDVGPCGPCSEIHIDLRSEDDRKKVSGASLVNEDHPQVVEVWNLVFMEFNRTSKGTLENLPEKHVDTGMGFERLCMALQNVQSNYDTDVFQPAIQELEKLSGFKYGADTQKDIAFRVISDHVRAVSFAIADGQLPSNNGAGYVIRRILRRAIRYGYTFLNLRDPFIYHLVDVLEREMGPFFPEIVKQKTLVEKVIREEEQGFLRTLENGLQKLENCLPDIQNKQLDGKIGFELYDTFGFPQDLTSLILSEKGYSLDVAGFEEEMAKQKERSRSASSLSVDDWVVLCEGNPENFIGYDQIEAEVKILKYRKVEQKKKTLFQLVFNQTPFYPEGGGQVGDTGIIRSSDETIHIVDTKKENGQIIHFTEVLPENKETGFTAVVDLEKRKATARNHTATHLLHETLREVLGTHVEQKGSLVSPDYLRFDFSHFQKLSSNEIQEIQSRVNAKIRNNFSLEEYRSIPHQVALDMGAMALFGEKYGDKVRAIKFGSSIELCGGTHVSGVGEIGHFQITHEGAVAAGIRRIEAITGEKSEAYLTEKLQQLHEVGVLLKSSGDVVKQVDSLKKEVSKLQKENQQLQKEKALQLSSDLLNEAEDINGIKFIGKVLALDMASIKDIAFDLKSKSDTLVAVFGAVNGPKANLSVALSDDMIQKGLKAGQIVKEISSLINGGGGGQPAFASAGGSNPDGLQAAIQKAREIITQQ